MEVFIICKVGAIGGVDFYTRVFCFDASDVEAESDLGEMQRKNSFEAKNGIIIRLRLPACLPAFLPACLLACLLAFQLACLPSIMGTS